MTTRKIHQTPIVNRAFAKVHRESETNEYRVSFYRLNTQSGEYERNMNADYFTDDKQDALGTAELFIEREADSQASTQS